jgi:TonB family protein
MEDFDMSSADFAGDQTDPLADLAGEHQMSSPHDPPEEVHASLASAVRAHRTVFQPAKRRRLFGIPLAGGLSLTTSILVHVAIICIGFGMYRHFRPPPALDFALGDASETRNALFWKEQTSGGAGMPTLSEIDPVKSPPNSAASMMRQLESNQAPDFPITNLASTYIGPRASGNEAPNAGAQSDKAANLGTVATHHPTAVSPKPESGAAAPSTARRGNGQGNATGSGNANANTGRAGAPTGDPHLIMPGAVYPEESIRRDEQGTVNLSVAVAGDGTVREVKVVSAPPFARLTRSAISAVRKQHFDMAYANATITVSYIFTLH